MSTTQFDADESTAVEPRTRRAVTEAMTVVPHGGGSGMFDVSSSSGNMYTVDLREGRCTCPDFTQREPAGGCKHVRRVRLAIGLMDVPASLDIDHCLQNSREKFGATETTELEPDATETETSGRAIATDGGVVLEEPETEVDVDPLKVNRIATEAVANTDGRLADFDVFQVTVETTQDTLIRAIKASN